MRRFPTKVFVAFVGLLLPMGTALAEPTAPIRLLYFERKPFNYSDESGKVIGLTAEPAAKVFTAAGIPFKWEVRSANAILDALKRDTAPVCTPGWYHSEQRASFAQYTVPIYRDKVVVGLASKAFQYKGGTTAKDLLARPDVRLMVKQHFVNGTYLDEIIAQMPAKQIVTEAGEVSEIVRLIYLNRSDLFIMTQEEVEVYVNKAELKMTDFNVLNFPDIPAVEMRYILCSKQVSPATIEALNAAIVKTVRISR
jgi:polar amino acid transport system substrate-binding protein